MFAIISYFAPEREEERGNNFVRKRHLLESWANKQTSSRDSIFFTNQLEAFGGASGELVREVRSAGRVPLKQLLRAREKLPTAAFFWGGRKKLEKRKSEKG